MNLIKSLLQEHSKAQRDRIVNYIGNDAKRFSQLVDLFLDGPYRVTQRAAWPLSYCAQRHPELIKPHLIRIIRNLKKTGLSDSIKRNTMRLLQFIPIPKSQQGTIVSVCFGLLQNSKEAIAIRVFSMSVLANLVKDQPELRNELKVILEDQLPYGSAGFVSRARKVLRTLKVEL